MRPNRCAFLCAALLFAAPLLVAQVKESTLTKQLGNLRSLSATERPVATLKLAQEIATLPAGLPKLRLARTLAGLSTEGEAGHETLQAVADTLSKALAESPIPAKGDRPPEPYLELAQFSRYLHVTVNLDAPQYVKAGQVLAAEDADVQKADFTLKDLHGKKYTLSELRGKIVMVNFWATWCQPCRVEMPELDAIYNYFQSQGLVVLSITDEDAFKTSSFIAPTGYHPPVLLDPGGGVHKAFHIEGVPTTFIFNRDGKLIGKSIDRCTRHQFLEMLSVTDLHP